MQGFKIFYGICFFVHERTDGYGNFNIAITHLLFYQLILHNLPQSQEGYYRTVFLSIAELGKLFVFFFIIYNLF